MSKRDGKPLRQRRSLFVLAVLSPILFAECSLILNDLPQPEDAAPNSSAGTAAGEPSSNHGGKSGGGGSLSSSSGAENSAGSVTPAGGVGGGGMPPFVDGGNNATAASGGESGRNGSNGDGGDGGKGCPCDCDKDGTLNDDPGCHAGGGPADCDDDDPDVHPGQKSWLMAPNPNVGFDYDCSDTIEQRHTEVLTCPAILAQCDETKQGFIGAVPECGDTGTWGYCHSNGLICAPLASSDDMPNGCH